VAQRVSGLSNFYPHGHTSRHPTRIHPSGGPSGPRVRNNGVVCPTVRLPPSGATRRRAKKAGHYA
jgi:hypothetical protein